MGAKLLTAVELVCASRAHVTALPHVLAHNIDAFLLPAIWTLKNAAKHGHLRLLDRLLQVECAGFTRCCREQRLHWGATDAIKKGYGLPVVKWWLRKYMPDQDVFSMAQALELTLGSSRKTQIPLLEWIYEETNTPGEESGML